VCLGVEALLLPLLLLLLLLLLCGRCSPAVHAHPSQLPWHAHPRQLWCRSVARGGEGRLPLRSCVSTPEAVRSRSNDHLHHRVRLSTTNTSTVQFHFKTRSKH
jgi:hypothetical protein